MLDEKSMFNFWNPDETRIRKYGGICNVDEFFSLSRVVSEEKALYLSIIKLTNLTLTS